LHVITGVTVPLAPGPAVMDDGCPSMAMSAVPASCCRPSSLCLINTWTQSAFLVVIIAIIIIIIIKCLSNS